MIRQLLQQSILRRNFSIDTRPSMCYNESTDF